MLEKIEFYNTPDGAVYVKQDDGSMVVYDLSRKQLTQELVALITDLYPEAFAALSELYSKSARNKEFFEFRVVHRFIRCNFGEYDTLKHDIGNGGAFHFEQVKCPLRGECRYEGIICAPTMQTKLSDREQQVADVLATGISHREVGEELGISKYTVQRHITNIKKRLHIKSTRQLISYFNGKDRDC